MAKKGEKLPDVLSNNISKGYVDDVKALVNANPNVVQLSDSLSNNVLHVAATSGRDSVMEYLLSVKGIEKVINQKNHMGDTPLHKATGRSNAGCVKLLLSKKADTKVENNDGKKPGDLARTDEIKKMFGVDDDVEIVISDDEKD